MMTATMHHTHDYEVHKHFYESAYNPVHKPLYRHEGV
jgi:hypothetical protein